MGEQEIVRQAGDVPPEWLKEPEPVAEEAPQKWYSSGLVQLLLGVGAAAIVGTLGMGLAGSHHRLEGATRSTQLRVQQRQAQIAAAAEADAASKAPASPAPATATPDRAGPTE